MPARWASSAPSRSCPATSAARPTPCPCTSRSSTTNTTSSPRSPRPRSWPCWRSSRSPRRRWSSGGRPKSVIWRRAGTGRRDQDGCHMSIAVRHVSKRFGTFTALDDVTLDVPSGELVALLGPSGSGKTTLLRIIAGLEVADAGTILFDGEDATAQHVRDRARRLRVPALRAVPPHDGVREHRLRAARAAAARCGRPSATSRHACGSCSSSCSSTGSRTATLAALGRPAPAHRPGSRARRRAARAAAGRALRGARRQGAGKS